MIGMTAPLDLNLDEIVDLCAQAPPRLAALLRALLDQLTAQEQLLTARDQTIATLTARVQELEDQRRRTSRNSHHPPSSDGYKKQPRSLRGRSTKPSGGQAGHPGQTLTFSAQPDRIEVHHPSHCADCG